MFRTAALVLALAAVPARAQTAPDFSAITALLQDSLAQVGGGEFLLLQHGRVLYRASFAGWDSTRAVPIASASKWLSGTLVMALVADGTLSLDDTVGRWLPDAPEDKRAITLRQLVTHTSGLPGQGGGGCLEDRATTLDACARAALGGPMQSAPGTAFRYGGLSMQVAGRIAEVAAGQPFNELFAARVASPLGLTQTDFGPGLNPRVAGGARSTAAEYARVLQALVDGGGPILTLAAVDAMLADQTDGAPIAYSPYQSLSRLAGDPELAETRYGVGVWRETADLGAGGGLEAASPGAFGFSPWIDRSRGIVAVLAVQNRLGAVFPTYLRLKAIVRDALGQPTDRAETPPAAPDLSVWPNPVRHGLVVSVQGAAPGTIRLVDALGRDVVVRRVAGPGAYRIDVGGLAPGAYAVVLDRPDWREARRVTVIR